MTASTTEIGAAPTARRIAALDALRGFALCGIIFINIPQTMDMMHDLSDAPAGVRLFVLGRFYPIFYLLFGLGFGLFLRSAARRTDRPRVPMVRRLLVLGVLGALHHLLQPGEVLLPFAITGLVVLLPLSYAPARVNLVAGALLTVAGVLVGVGGFGVLPGLFTLGFALSEVAHKLEELTTALGVAVVGCAVLAGVSYLIVVTGTGGELAGRWFGLLFSMCMATAYAAAFLLMLRTPAGPALSAFFAPLGRMALTNYLTATVLFVTFDELLGLRWSDRWGTVGLLGAAILLVQAIWSPVWLRHFGYGPLEWMWRAITYRRRIPIRRRQEADAR